MRAVYSNGELDMMRGSRSEITSKGNMRQKPKGHLEKHASLPTAEHKEKEHQHHMDMATAIGTQREVMRERNHACWFLFQSHA